MGTQLECCIRNIDSSERERVRSETEAEVNLIEKPCLQRCGDCMQGKFIVVDGEFHATQEELVEVVETR